MDAIETSNPCLTRLRIERVKHFSGENYFHLLMNPIVSVYFTKIQKRGSKLQQKKFYGIKFSFCMSGMDNNLSLNNLQVVRHLTEQIYDLPL